MAGECKKLKNFVQSVPILNLAVPRFVRYFFAAPAMFQPRGGNAAAPVFPDMPAAPSRRKLFEMTKKQMILRFEFDVATPDHFRKISDRETAMRMFKNSINMLEIEVFSYCNRRCWFCPNAQIDRRSKNEYMDPELYTGIMRQLAEVDYNEVISYSRYNEPLADRVILERLKEANETVPNALLHTNTNGDYLTFDYLEELYGAGLRSLNIQVYLQNDQRYDHDLMRKKSDFLIKKLGLPAELKIDKPGLHLEHHLDYKDMSLRVYARNFEVNGCSRGDTLPIRQDYVRTMPCPVPFRFLYIDYNGKMVPCCNLRSDMPQHEECVYCDLGGNNDIFAAYAASNLVMWRRALVGFEEKAGVCRSCSYPDAAGRCRKKKSIIRKT